MRLVARGRAIGLLIGAHRYGESIRVRVMVRVRASARPDGWRPRVW